MHHILSLLVYMIGYETLTYITELYIIHLNNYIL
jgi:hypothetical protein